MDVPRYLDRIGLAGERPEPTPNWLARLTLAHLLAVPFENLDIGLGRPISLDPGAIYDKVVTRRRGGFCYELNGLFALLLEQVGFSVELLSGRTVGGVHGELGPEFDHLVLLVEADGPVLVDVGWGEAYRAPFALVEGGEHRDEHMGTYRLVRHGEDWDVRERLEPGGEAEVVGAAGEGEGEAWRTAYRFRLTPYRLPDFEQTCVWQQTESPFFTQRRVCTIATPRGRRTLMDDRLIVRERGERMERPVAEDEVPALLDELFGVVL